MIIIEKWDGESLKRDIFHGKIKREYFSYILGYMIFFMLLFVVGGALCIYAFVLEGSFNVSGERLLLAMFGVVAFVLGGGYVFPQLFLIRNFPKYPKLRRIFLPFIFSGIEKDFLYQSL